MSLAECAVHIAHRYCCCQCTSIGICYCQVIVTCCKSCNVFCGCCKSSRSCPCIGKCSCGTSYCKIYRSIIHSTTCKSDCISLCKCIGCLSNRYCYRKYASIGVCYCKVIVSCCKSCKVL